MASNGKEAEFHEGIKNNASIVNASPTLIVSKNVDGTYEHTLPGSIPLTSSQITTALGYAPIGTNTSMTGLTEGALITINTDTAKFNVSAGTGFIINGNLAVPTVTPVTINASTANIIPNLATQKITFVAIDINGDLYLTNAQLTATERRNYIRLGVLIHLNNTNIEYIDFNPTVNKEAGGQIQDILEVLGFRSLSGNRVFPVSNNLKIKKELGRVFKSGSNFSTLATQPHSFPLPAQDPITFRYRTQTGSEGADITDITPAIYDLNGTITAVGSTATLATIQRIYIFQDGIIRIQPGQRVFTSLNGAVTALNSDVFITDFDIENNALYLGAIVLTRNTVDLSNIAQAIFIPSPGTNVNGSAPALGYTAEDVANKQNSLAVDGTAAKYPTVDAVNTALALKLGGSGTTNFLPKFTNSNTLGNSIANENGYAFGINGNDLNANPGDPKHAFDVTNDAGDNFQYLAQFTSYANSTGLSNFHIRKARGTALSPLAILNQDVLASFGFRGYATTKFASSSIAIQAIAEQNFTDTANGTSLLFQTTPIGNFDSRVDALKLEASGKANFFNTTTTPNLNAGVNVGNIGLGDVKIIVKQPDTLDFHGLGVIASSNNNGVFLAHTGTIARLSVNYGNGGAYTNLALTAFGIDALTLGSAGVATFASSVTATSHVTTGGSASQLVKGDGGLTVGYKVYTALLSQTGTAAPVATILENTTAAVITWGYSSPGGFTGTSTGLFTASKTAVLFSNGISNNGIFGAQRSNNNFIFLSSSEATTNSPSNNLINNATIEIRVYN